MNDSLPAAFIARMQKQLGAELPAFLHEMDQPALRGIRWNILRKPPESERQDFVKPVPWRSDAWYLAGDSAAGAEVLHEAGAYYLQEPSAMIPAAVLNAKPGERILDLCAAPGGKTTQIGIDMRGQGLLVSNDPVLKRAQVLSRNVERMGLTHTAVICALPETLSSRWERCFDAVLADVPCSGEGMFRRVPASRTEWSAEKAEGCAERQRNILHHAAALVRPGGRLVYSTCTYNPGENEENVRWFLLHHPEFRICAFSLEGIDAPEGMFTCYPHRMEGEGQFTALLVRQGEGFPESDAASGFPAPGKREKAVFMHAFPALPEPNLLFGQTLCRLETPIDLTGIKTLRLGLHLGEVRGSVPIPDHAAALMFRRPDMPLMETGPEDIRKYLGGETLAGEAAGWMLITYRGYALGWGKGSGGMIKNHYPRGLRGLHFTA